MVRNEQNNRLYTDNEIDWLLFLKCLRETGMSVEEIKKYYDMVKAGTSTLPERTKLIQDQKQALLDDIEKKKLNSFTWSISWSAIIAGRIISILSKM